MFLAGGVHFSTAGQPESGSTMLASPLTSTPFSVKDILKMEQQQQQQQQHQPRALEHQRSPHSEIGLHHHHHHHHHHQQHQQQQQQQQQQHQHFPAPPSCCMLAGAAAVAAAAAASRDSSPPFSEGEEDSLAYLSALRVVQEEPAGEASLSPGIVYGGGGGALQGLCKLEAVEQPGESSEWMTPAVVVPGGGGGGGPSYWGYAQ